MNWKNRYNKPYVGCVYKLNPNSDKSLWDIVEDYEATYILTVLEKGPSGIKLIEQTADKPVSDWLMGEPFLKQHFIKAKK